MMGVFGASEEAKLPVDGVEQTQHVPGNVRFFFFNLVKEKTNFLNSPWAFFSLSMLSM